MVDLSASINTGKVLKNLDKFFGEKIYVAASKAEQRTVKDAQKKAKELMPRQLDRPTKGAINAVRMQFRQAKDIKAKRGGSKIFIADYLVDELWYNTVTEESNRPKRQDTNPEGGKFGIVRPARRTRNKNTGNMRGLRSGALTRARKNADQYFEVKIGSKVKGQPGINGGYLVPGLYQIYGRSRRGTRRIRLLVEYQKSRTIVPKYKFREIAISTYSKHYPEHMSDAIAEEIKKLIKSGSQL